MAEPFYQKHWNLLTAIANNFKDHLDRNGGYSHNFTIHDQLTTATFNYFNYGEWFSHNNSQVWNYNRPNVFDSVNLPEETGGPPWTTSLLNPMQDRIDELYNKAYLEGTVPSPWPSDVSKLTTSMVDQLKQSCHWSPREWTDKWVYDTYGTQYYNADGTYIGGTYVSEKENLHYRRVEVWNASGIITIAVRVIQPHVSLVQVLPANVIQGATLDWIIPYWVFNNSTYLPYVGGDSQFNYNPVGDFIYLVAKSYPINSDGSCNLTEYQFPSSSTYIHSSKYIDPIIRGQDSLFLSDNGNDTNEFWTCLALNFDNAEFI